MGAKCLLQIICIQSVNEMFVNLNKLAKNPDLAHLCWDVGGIAHPPVQKKMKLVT